MTQFNKSLISQTITKSIGCSPIIKKLGTFMFKDEVGEKILNSVIALKSKLYSSSMGENKKLSAKGTIKYVQKSLKRSVFVRSLAKDLVLRTLNYRIISENIYFP